jgi:4-hydroxybenzoyl-CoA thioesterase
MANFLSRRQFTIEWGHCDPAGIVFNSRFFEFFDWGTWVLFETALGVKPAALAGAFGITGIPLVDASARFLAPARFGDVVELTSQVKEFRRSSFDVEHQLIVRGELAVEGRETRVWATRDAADPSRIKAQPVPDEVIARFRAP